MKLFLHNFIVEKESDGVHTSLDERVVKGKKFVDTLPCFLLDLFIFWKNNKIVNDFSQRA